MEAEPEIGRQHGWSAWMLSVVMHATVLIACGLLAPVAAENAPGETQRAVGIALVTRTNTDAVEYFSGEQPQNQVVTHSGATTEESFEQKLPSLAEFSQDLAAALPQAEASLGSAGSGLALPNANAFTTGTSGGNRQGGMAGNAQTTVFGARGTGTKFVYVFDRSSSMGGFDGRPLAAAKAELVRSLNDLAPVHQFQIVFYNDRPSVFNPFSPSPPTMLFATDENRQLGQQFANSITALGGTRHREALELALAMSPDVIFFLTDANEPELSADELANLRRRNRAEATINTIEFGVGPASGGENFLGRLARQNHGQYVYVDITALRSDQ